MKTNHLLMRLFHLPLLCGLLLAPDTTALAQAPASAPAGNDEVVVLSPFSVTAEKGWTASDTLSATRTRQLLKDVPVNIDAITSDFMEDLGLDSADAVAGFVANVYALPIMENDNMKGNFSFRGLSQTNNVSRNYFRWYIPSDTYNVERFDFGKGSNSLIFGEVEPGGNGASFTKRPLQKNFGSILARVNSEGGYRYQFDFNRTLNSRLALRVNAVNRLDKTYQDSSTYEFKAATVALAYQVFKSTAIRLEYEQGEYKNARGLSGINVREQSARGLGFGTAGTYFTSDGVWITQSALPSADRSSANNPSGGQPSLVEGGYFDVQQRDAAGNIVGTKRINGFPKSYNIRGAFDNHSRPFHTFSATVEQQIGPVSTEFAYNHQYQSEERNDNNFDSTISTDVNGRPYIDSSLDRKHFTNDVDAFRGTAVYKFDKLPWMEQILVASYEYREDMALNQRWQYFNTAKVDNGTATTINATADRGRLRLYLDDPAFYSRALFERMQPSALPVTSLVNMVPLRYFASGNSAADGTEWRQAYAASFSASGRYFGGRLQSLLGARRDTGRLYTYVATRKEGKYNEDVFTPKKSDALPGEYVENMNMHLSNTSYAGGLTFALTKNLNLYGIYSESFRFQDNRTFDRVTIGPISGVTKEIGLKGNMLKNRASLAFGLFEIDRQNVVLSWNNVVSFSDSNTEDLMNPNNVLPGDPNYKYREPGTASASRNYTATEQSQGADLTLMVQAISGLQLRFTLAYADVSSIPDLGSFRAYYDAAVKRPDESPAMLADAKLLLDTLDFTGRSVGPRAAPWSASWVADYTFPKASWTLLKGVRLGMNGIWRDDYFFGQSNGQQLIGGSTHLVSAYLSRTQKIWGQDFIIRADIRNLTDLENGNIRKTGFARMASGANVYTYSYVMPTQYDLSVTVKF
jgi:hypothetical protein